MKVKILILLLLIYANSLWSQTSTDLLRKGNSKYKESRYEEAELNYRKALEQNPNERRAVYNLGNSLFKQGKYNESQQKYLEIINSAKEKDEKAIAHYNLGNSYLKEKKYKESIEQYKKALKLNPKDFDSKYNLEYARRMLIMEQQRQKENQNQKDSTKNENKTPQEQNKNQANQNKSQQNLTQQNIQNILNALRNEEKKTQKEVRAKLLPRVEKNIEKN
ncbi:MAG: tetratricopeptide repeat protein, partial [Candidatus Kapaibacteriota bacterium]